MAAEGETGRLEPDSKEAMTMTTITFDSLDYFEKIKAPDLRKNRPKCR